MQRVRLTIPRTADFASDAAFEVYGDLGSGTVEVNHPLPPGRVRLWQAADPRAGHVLDAHLVSRHLDSVDAEGHFEGRHLCDAHLAPALPVNLESPRYVFGRFLHRIRMFDGAGNAAGSDVDVAVTVNSAPQPPAGLRRIGWDEQARRITFAFNPVRFHAVAGG